MNKAILYAVLFSFFLPTPESFSGVNSWKDLKPCNSSEARLSELQKCVDTEQGITVCRSNVIDDQRMEVTVSQAGKKLTTWSVEATPPSEALISVSWKLMKGFSHKVLVVVLRHSTTMGIAIGSYSLNIIDVNAAKGPTRLRLDLEDYGLGSIARLNDDPYCMGVVTRWKENKAGKTFFTGKLVSFEENKVHEVSQFPGLSKRYTTKLENQRLNEMRQDNRLNPLEWLRD